MGGGSPNPNTTQQVTTTQELPAWYQQFLTQVMGSAQNVAATPYQAYGQAPVAPTGAAPVAPDAATQYSDPAGYAAAQQKYTTDKASYDSQQASYTAAKAQWDALTPDQQAAQGQRVANLTPDQQAAYATVGSLQGQYAPLTSQAAGLYSGAAGANTNAALAGSLGSAAMAGQRQYGQADQAYGQADQAYGGALNQFGQAANAQTASLYDPYQSAATNFTYQAGQQADPLIQASTNPTGLSAASPYLQAAGQPVSNSISQYMSPYTGSVVNAIAQQSARNLQENLMPALSDDFVKAGQYGSTRQQQLAQNLVRDTNQDTLNQQAQALESGYNQAGSLAEQDASRQAQLAGTAGGLGSAQQQQMLQAGSTLGNLGLGQSSSLSGLGSTGASLAQGQVGQQIQAAQGMSGVGSGYAGIGAGLTNLGGTQGSQALNLAQLLSGNYNTNTNQQMQAAQGLSNTAQTNQGLALQGAAAQEAAGQAQQQQQQTSLNQAYQDFLNQRNYPQQQVDFLSSIIHGLPVNTSSYQSSTGPATTSQLQPSAAGQAAGVGVGLAGVSKLLAKGGAVRKKVVPRGLGSYSKAA